MVVNRTKDPIRVLKDRRRFTFAPALEKTGRIPNGEWLRTCTIITGEPNELVAQVHPRMPVILPEEHHAAWLGETDDGNLTKSVVTPLPCRPERSGLTDDQVSKLQL